MSLVTPERVWNFQQSLQAKAKANPKLRFYSLYDKIYRRDVLAFAYRRCRANGGSAGVDGQTFETIESAGLEAWLDELTEELKRKTYQPQAVRRVYIGTRPARKKVKRICEEISEATQRSTLGERPKNWWPGLIANCEAGATTLVWVR